MNTLIEVYGRICDTLDGVGNWLALLLKASKKLLMVPPGHNLLSLYFVLLVTPFFPFFFLLYLLVWCPDCTGLLLSDLHAANKSHNEC